MPAISSNQAEQGFVAIASALAFVQSIRGRTHHQGHIVPAYGTSDGNYLRNRCPPRLEMPRLK